MSVVIGSKDTFLGVPLKVVRDVLKAWHRGKRSDLWSIAGRKDIGLSPRTVMVLIEEMRSRGLIGMEEREYGSPVDGLTEAGFALAGATARKRMSRNKAREILIEFLKKCISVNDRNDLPFKIDRVWLFGSMLDLKKLDVGDVDLVVEYGRPKKYQSGDSARKRFRELGAQMNAPQRSGLMSIMGDQDFVERKLLHGGKRHPVLSMHGIDELQAMACPCQLIFDASRAGIVEDPLLKRHPKSKLRIDKINTKRQMPDLKRGGENIFPVDASLFSCCVIDYKTLSECGPWPAESVRYRIIYDDASCVSMVCENSEKPDYEMNALAKRVDFAGCDGRSRFGMLLIKTELIDNEDWRKGYKKRLVASMTVCRAIEVSENSIIYSMDVVEADHLGKGLEYSYILTFVWWINHIVSTDLEHVIRWKEEIEGKEYILKTGVVFSSKSPLAENVKNMYREKNDAMI